MSQLIVENPLKESQEPLLFQRFPGLSSKLPWIPLTQLPTPVHVMEQLSQALGADLWIKRDDCSALPYGGNKPRKLEFLLGHALSRGARTVITFGALGSNHVLSTTVAARQLGMQCVGVLIPEPLSEPLLRTLQTSHAQGAILCYAPSDFRAGLQGIWQWTKALIRDKRRPYLIMPGGSSPRGCLGYVNAALELAEQIAAQECPEPQEIYIPVGSNGTFAGLLVGCRLAGLKSRVIGVRVSDYAFTSRRAVLLMARQCCRLLERMLQRPLGIRLALSDVCLEEGYLGAGYAHPTPAGRAAIQTLLESEGILLEEVYTGKTFAALLDACQHNQSGCKLFWNTYNSQPLEALLPHEHNYLSLPSAFHRFFSDPIDKL